MKKLLVVGLSLACLASFTVDLSYADFGEHYVICYRYGKGRCKKCAETIILGARDPRDHRDLCNGVGETFDTSRDAEGWRALNCTCPGSK